MGSKSKKEYRLAIWDRYQRVGRRLKSKILARLAPVRFPTPKSFDAYPQFLGAFLPVFLHLHAPFEDLLANASRSFGC